MGRGEGAATGPTHVARRKGKERTLSEIHKEAYDKSVRLGRLLAEEHELSSLRHTGVLPDAESVRQAAERSVETTKDAVKVRSGSGPGVDTELSHPAFLGFLAQSIFKSCLADQQIAEGTTLETLYSEAITRVFGRKAYKAEKANNPTVDVYEEADGRTVGTQIKGTVRVDDKSFILSHLRHIPGALDTDSKQKAAFRALADEAESLERFIAFAYEGVNDKERPDFDCGLFTIPTSHFGKLREIKPRSKATETDHLKIKFNAKSVSVEVFDTPRKLDTDLVMRINLSTEDSRVFISNVRKAKVVCQGVMTVSKEGLPSNRQRDDLDEILEESQPIRNAIKELEPLAQLDPALLEV